MFIFLLQNRQLQPKIDCKNNGKWKLQTCFSGNYDFELTNLLKNSADFCQIFVKVCKHKQQNSKKNASIVFKLKMQKFHIL